MELSQAERLTLLMLCDIYEKLGIDNGYDPAFIRKTIDEGNTWAISWQYPGIFSERETTEQQVSDVTDILEMWHRMEWSYEKLGSDDQEQVKAANFGFEPRFPGFDGNGEGRQISITDLLVNHMHRWERFKGRDLNAHVPTLELHHRMLSAFNKESGMPRGLSASELIALLSEQVHPENRQR